MSKGNSFEVIYKNLLTNEETSFFIRNLESYFKGKVAKESFVNSYPFLNEVDLDFLKKEFPEVRSILLSRKKIKIYTPITISRDLTKNVYEVLSKFSKSELVLEFYPDTSIVAGLKFEIDGKIFDLTLDKINSKKNSK